MSDVLNVQGRMTMGYGIIPKIIMQDKRLTIEAKAIYSYFCSYAGAGTTAFPSRDKILYDLQLGENRYYKHFNLLKKYGYIEVLQNTDNTGKFKNNVYTLIEMIEPYPQNEGTDKKPYLQNPHTDNPHTENEGTKINNFKINNSYNQQSSQSQGQSQTRQMTLTIDNEPAQQIILDIKKEPLNQADQSNGLTPSCVNNQFPIDDYTIYEKIIKKNISYDELIQAHPHEQNTIDELINVMLDVICTRGDTVKINSEEKSRSMIKNVYCKINYSDIEHIIDRFKNQRHKITHLHSYLKTMLYTVKQEQSHYYDNAVRTDGVVW